MVDKALAPVPIQHFDDDDGNPLSGGKLFVYHAGTTTKATTWTSADGLTPNTNPVVLDARGEGRVWVESSIPDPVEPNPPGPPGARGPQGQPGPPGATGNTAEFSYTVDIDSATIFTGFYGEFIEIVPAPAANEFLLPSMIGLSYKYAVAPYATNSADFQFFWGPPTLPSLITSTVAEILEDVVDDVQVMIPITNASILNTVNGLGKNMTISLSAQPDGAQVLSVTGISDGGAGYAVGDAGTIDDGDGNATYEILTETAGVATSASITFGGNGYTDATDVATTATSGVGTGLLLDIATAETISGTLRVTTWYRKLTQQP